MCNICYTEKLQIHIKTHKIHIKAEKNYKYAATDAMNVCVTASFTSFLLEALHS